MSKLAKLITAAQSWPIEHAYLSPKMRYVNISDSASTAVEMGNTLIRYRIKAEFGAQVWLRDDLTLNSPAVDHATYDIRRAVIEEVFGEFRPILNNIRVELYNNNYENIRELLETLERQMFREGLHPDT